jgi:hypothetical protein
MPKSSRSIFKAEAARLYGLEQKRELELGKQIVGMTECPQSLLDELIPYYRGILREKNEFRWVELSEFLRNTFVSKIEEHKLDKINNRRGKYRDKPMCSYDHHVRRLNKFLRPTLSIENLLNPELGRVLHEIQTMQQRVNGEQILKLTADQQALLGRSTGDIVPFRAA